MSTSLNLINLPINRLVLNSSSVASIPVVKNSFLDIKLSASIGSTSTINIIREFNDILYFSGKVNKNFRIGGDPTNKIPFTRNQTVNIIFNIGAGETITVENFSYNLNTPLNFKIIIFIFLIVYFTINVHFDKK